MITSHRRKKSKPVLQIKHFAVFPQFGGPYFNGKEPLRKKVNFMIKKDLIEAMKFFIPGGERSDFVNVAVEESLRNLARRKAMEAMDEFRKKAKLKMTDEEIRKAINYGRE